VTLKVSLLLFETYVSIPTVVHVHDGALVIRGVINNIGGSRRWLITVTVQLTSTILVVWKSVDYTHGIAYSLCDSCA